MSLYFAIFVKSSKTKSSMKSILFLLLAMSFALPVESQILGRATQRAVRQFERRIEEKLIGAIADEIARQAFRPVEEAIDSILREKYQDSINREEVDWELMAESYAAFLNGLNEAANLPEQYEFDIRMDIEAVDYDGKKSKSIMFFSESSSIIGIENELSSDKEKQLVVIDIKEDLIVLYTTDKNGTKTAQAVPSMIKLLSKMAPQNDTQSDEGEWKITKTGKTRTIAGYKTTQYKGDTEEEFIEFYASENFPITWQSSFGPYLEQFAPQAFTNRNEDIAGMVMQSTNIKKSDSSKKSSWETTFVEKKQVIIKNSDYEFRALHEE